MNELPQERLLIGNVSQCSAEFAFEETRAYVKSRKAFKRTLADLQVNICFKLFYFDISVLRFAHRN